MDRCSDIFIPDTLLGKNKMLECCLVVVQQELHGKLWQWHLLEQEGRP